MKKQLAASLVVLGALAVAPMSVYADKHGATSTKESAKEHVSDAWITSKIKGEFAKDKAVSAMKIHVDTDKGVVKLTGRAKSQDESDRAAALAKNTKGVTSVVNDIQVGATTAGYK
jgi:hyperosmotically inducible periplasmic protein